MSGGLWENCDTTEYAGHSSSIIHSLKKNILDLYALNTTLQKRCGGADYSQVFFFLSNNDSRGHA